MRGFQASTFFIEAVDLGDLEKLVVEKSAGPQWHLSQITVKKGAFAPTEDVFRYDRSATYTSLASKVRSIHSHMITVAPHLSLVIASSGFSSPGGSTRWLRVRVKTL